MLASSPRDRPCARKRFSCETLGLGFEGELDLRKSLLHERKLWRDFRIHPEWEILKILPVL